ncbi:MAG: hypothetical protein NTV22_03240 [bacterium]|nr:hypothetical protein [bacterium]
MNPSRLFCATLMTVCALPLAAAPPAPPASTSDAPAAITNAAAPATSAGDTPAALTNVPPAGTNVTADAEADEVKNVFTKPTLKSVAEAVKAVQSGVPEAAAKTFMDMMGWDVRTQRGINDFFKNSLTFTTTVVRRGNSPNVKRMIDLARANPYQMKEGEHVIVYYPKTISAMAGGKPVRKPFDEICPVDQLVAAADQAFTQTADALLFSPFLYWGQKARAKIFLIADPASWQMMQRGSGARPAGTIVTEPDYRELYVHVTPLTAPLIDQAVAFAISEQVIGEYSMIVSGKSKTQAPLFFTTGLAGAISGLSSVMTEQGPQQVRRLGTREIGPKDIMQLRKKAAEGKAPSEQLPLQASRLIPIARLLEATSYPSGAEEVYYLMRQDTALIKYLRENGPLAFLALARNLAEGRGMDRSFDNVYAKLRTDISGKPSVSKEDKSPPLDKKDKNAKRDRKDKTKESTDAYTPDDVLSKVKELKSRAHKAIFLPLTEEAMQEQARDASKK